MTFEPTVLTSVVIAVMTLEGVALVLLRPSRAIDVLSALAPGMFLALAAHFAVADAHWTYIGLFLALSGPAHLFDMSRRGLYPGRSAQTTPRARKSEMSASE